MRWTYALSVLSMLLLSCNEKEEAWKASLENPFPEARIAALKRLIEKLTPGDLEYLALAARDVEPGVRRVAAEGLGKSRDRYALDLLSDLLMDADEEVQVAAALAMGRNSSEKARKYLLLRYSKSRRPMRYAIVQALKASGLAAPMKQAVGFEAKELWEKTQRELASPPSHAEWVSAIARLGESGRDEAVESLLPLLKEKTSAVVVAAAEGLGNLGAQAALAELEILALSSNADIRRAGIAAVAALQATSSIPLLIRLTTAEEETALLALEGLASFASSTEVDKAICELAVQPGNRLLRFRAALALAQRAPCSPRPLFEQLSNASLAPTALLVLMRWPDAWSNEADRVWALTKSSDLVLSTLAAQLLSQAYLRGELQEKPAKELRFILEQIGVLAKKEESWIKSPLGGGFGVRIPQGEGGDTERRQRQELLVKGIEARNAVLLKEMGKQASGPLLLPELAEELSWAEGEQLAAFLKLASCLKPEAVEPYLKRYINIANVSLRGVVLAALAGMGEGHGGLAEQGLFDRSEEVRLVVAEAFMREGIEGEKRLIAALGRRTEDSSSLLSLLSCRQLSEEGAQTLMDFLNKSVQEAMEAARCLGHAKQRGARDKLLILLNSTVLLQKKAALEALGEMGGGDISEEIEKQLFHESPEIREAAARALRYLRGGDLGEVLEALSEDYFKRVRQGIGPI
ncbi:MAG: HEAT repeat domain-containing protein [Cystobacterineae bacterium]|nr:HEAT repeat domain-containing protein [Cystobacterineae bacterium]